MRSLSLRTLIRRLLWAVAAAVVGGSAAVAVPGEPPSKPILRVETGSHTARIWWIDTDQSGRFLVTGSYDKTVRVWGIDTGALLQTLRPPIGEGNEGKILAVAISPDGETIACGGWTGNHGNYSIYLFERGSGRLTRRISGLPDVVHHLAFNMESKRLAAALGGPSGVRVFQTNNGEELARDSDYGETSCGGDFDRNGRLVTSSYDGSIRLSDPTLELVAKVQAPEGERPLAVSFSPDGRRVAVGYGNSARVEVFSAEDLSGLFSPDCSGTNNGLNIVAVDDNPKHRQNSANATFHKTSRWSVPTRPGRTVSRPGRSSIPTTAKYHTLKDHGHPEDRGDGVYAGDCGLRMSRPGPIFEAGENHEFVASGVCQAIGDRRWGPDAVAAGNVDTILARVARPGEAASGFPRWPSVTSEYDQGPTIMSWRDAPPYANSDTPFLVRYRAQCFCGTVRFEVRADPVDSKICHCRQCQLLHGAPFQWAVIFHKHHVRFVRGTASIYFYSAESSQAGHDLPCKLSCSTCRTPIADEGHRMFLAFGPLFDFGFPSRIPPSFEPTCHIFYGARVIDVPDTTPKYLGHKGKSPLWPGSQERGG